MGCPVPGMASGTNIWQMDSGGSVSLTWWCPSQEGCSCLNASLRTLNRLEASLCNFICPFFGLVIPVRLGLLLLPDHSAQRPETRS